MVLNSPFTKTLSIDLPPLLFWSRISDSSEIAQISEILPPRLQSSFCPKCNLTVKLYIFFSNIFFRGVKAGFQAPLTALAGYVVKCTNCATVYVSLVEL